ncbi:hypothetical protein EsDP_00006108 [Epichloe bromicola]|uniref:Uncharacterized protein n=1 Tax=Epichloe bromicola TaxID=79588 RepID=A0ABQ0CWM2_9HYPO
MNPLQPRTNFQFDPFEPHPELDNVDISEFENADWNSNSDPFGFFSRKGLSPPKLMEPAEVRKEARHRSSKIFEDYHKLRAIIERHEAVIQKRWEKKTRSQRLKILLDAWPNMPATHRPEFAAFRKHPKRLHEAAAKYRDSFMWPYINQEDLGKPKTLPLLLNARGRHDPSVFAAADGDVMHLGNVSMVLVPIFLNGHVMMLNGMTTEQDYGKVVSWDDHEDAFDWMHSRKQFLPGEGLAILEAQNRLLSFLVTCCHQILHDIPSEELVSDAYPVQPEPSWGANDESRNLASLSTLAEEAPYRVPAKLDFESIESLLAARAARAEEHILALREDPGYFAEHLIDIKEHRQEVLRDVEGKVHPTMKFPREKILWARIVGSAVVGASFQLEIFSKLRDQAQKLKLLQNKYANKISPLEDLPEEYLVALLKFRHYLNQAAQGPMLQLKTVVAASPPMRKYFVRDIPISPSSTKIVVMQKPGVKMDGVAQSVFYLLQTLWEDELNLFLYRLPVVVDELERLIQSNQRARDLVSPHVAYLISELAIIGECMRQLQLYQPWANGFEFALADKEEGLKREFAESTKSLGLMLGALHENNLGSVCEFGNPSDNKFDYPVGRRRNKANVDALRAAEANLDIFWAKIDDLLRHKAGRLDDTAWKQLLTKSRPLQRTPEWAEPAGGKNVKQSKHGQTAPGALTAPFSALGIGSEPSSVRKEVLAGVASKPKVKSHGTPDVRLAETTNAIPQPASASSATSDPHGPFSVDARALKVFRIVFFDPTANTTPGEVAWNDFLHAMSSVGFAARKLYGSVWHFQPTKLDVERSIQFHEPHPQGKVPFLMARRHGRRLFRAYGWSLGAFTLRDKSA